MTKELLDLIAAIEDSQNKDDGNEEMFEDAKEDLASRSGSVASSRSEVFQDAPEDVPVSSRQDTRMPILIPFYTTRLFAMLWEMPAKPMFMQVIISVKLGKQYL